MHRYSVAVKADVRRRMGPPYRQSVAAISQELGIHVITLYKWRKAWRLQGEVVPASQKDPEGWDPTNNLMVIQMIAFSTRRHCVATAETTQPSASPANRCHRPIRFVGSRV